MYTTYILYSGKINRYYTGHTIDLERRLQEHNRGKTAFMESGRPWTLIYSKKFQTRKEAVNHEAVIKKRGAERFLENISYSNG